MMRFSWLLVLLVLAAGCREEDGPLGGSGAGTIVVQSDPPNARISVDGKATGRLTPDTIRNVGGQRDLLVELDTAGLTYRYSVRIMVTGTEPVVVNGPLMARCLQQVDVCGKVYHDDYSVGNLRFGTNALGPLFFREGQGAGLFWPANSSNSYLSTGTPVFAALWEGEPVSTGVYDTEFMAGRPAPRTGLAGGSFVLNQTFWILPPPSLQGYLVARGIQVEERVVGGTNHDGLVLIELKFRNITRDPLYRLADPTAGTPDAGITYTNAFIGMALDPDIGDAEDDWFSYDEARATVYAYDSQFAESGFSSQQTAPALVGLRVLSAPPGTAAVLNGWANSSQGSLDWAAGTPSQVDGYQMLSGAASYEPDHPGTGVGHLPPAPGDVRITATVGPLQLAPGDSATVVLAVALAAPTSGTFVSGQPTEPGTPGDETRALHAVAAGLRSRLAAAESMLPLLQ